MMKLDIFSGFLGAGKTTLIKKLIEEAYQGEQVVLIENEFGEIGIDGGFLQDAGIQINEMNSGCICCSLVGDFGRALRQVVDEFAPQRILIEPSGVGKLSDIIEAVENLQLEELTLSGFATVVDAKKARIYMKNFGEFFNNQVEHASCVVLSHTTGLSQEKLDQTVALVREHNPHATIITTEWDKLTGMQILEAIEQRDTMEAALAHLAEEHHDHEHDHVHEHDHEHHHDHEDEHEHHHEHDHEHHHDHAHHHDHDDHDHDADEIFDSVGFETTHTFTKGQLAEALAALADEKTYGQILRAKGIVEGENGQWIHFDYVPGEPDVRDGSAGVTGRLCVIGADVDEDNIRTLFGL